MNGIEAAYFRAPFFPLLIASQEPPPRRFIAGADAIATAEQGGADLKAQIDAHRDLSTSLAFDQEPAGRAT